MKTRSRRAFDPARGATLVEVLVVVAMTGAVLGTGVMLLESWTGRTEHFRTERRRIRERERLAAAMADDLWQVRDVRIEGERLEILLADAGREASSIVYRLGDGRVVRTARGAKGERLQRDTFLMEGGREWRWEVERKGERFLVRCATSPGRPSKKPEGGSSRYDALVVSGRFVR